MQQKKNIISITTSAANSCAAHTITTFMKHISMLALLLMAFALGARGQETVTITHYWKNDGTPWSTSNLNQGDYPTEIEEI